MVVERSCAQRWSEFDTDKDKESDLDISIRAGVGTDIDAEMGRETRGEAPKGTVDDDDASEAAANEFYREGDSLWTRGDLKRVEQQIESQSTEVRCDLLAAPDESDDLRDAVEDGDHNLEAIEIHMALFDEDETEWEAPAWCEWAHGFNN